MATHNGMNLVDDGNKLLSLKSENLCKATDNIHEAIRLYDKAIKHCPYYAIPYFNKRIALFMKEETQNFDHEINNFTDELFKSYDLKLASPANTYFVINTAAAVPEHIFDEDSSDEEADENFNKLFERYERKGGFPYTTRFNRNTRRKTEKEIIDKLPYLNQHIDSRIIENFLSEILQHGFGGNKEMAKCNLSKIAVSIGLNRMYSLSTRKNKSLLLELESSVKTKDIKHEKFGFYWTCQWSDRYGKKVKYDVVRRFYKKLKNAYPNLATQFLEQEENSFEKSGSNVPFQDIREYVKNHEKTKHLVKEFRDHNADAIIYLHLVDLDVSHFNFVYDAYLRILGRCYITPTILTTGYEYNNSKGFLLASIKDRMLRVITSLYIPLGTYYPEPNLCILIPPNHETVPESFIDRTRGCGKNQESPILLSAIQNQRQNVWAIFSEDRAIYTAIPKRAKVSKISKKPLKFSIEFNEGPAAPSSKDIEISNFISQSHSNVLVWLSSLFTNNALKCNKEYETDGEKLLSKNNNPLKGVDKQCKKLIRNILRNEDVEHSKAKLSRRIGDNDAKNIVDAIKALNCYKRYFNNEHERTEEEAKLIAVMKDMEKNILDMSDIELLELARGSMVDLIKDGILDLTVIREVDFEWIKYISTKEDIVEALYNQKFFLNDLLTCFNENFDKFINAHDKNEFDVQNIVLSYHKDPLHLEFMGATGCCNDIILEEYSEDSEVIEFALKHHYIDENDIDEIRSMLDDGRNFDSTAVMVFTAAAEEAMLRIQKEEDNLDDHFGRNSDSESEEEMEYGRDDQLGQNIDSESEEEMEYGRDDQLGQNIDSESEEEMEYGRDDQLGQNIDSESEDLDDF